MKFRVLRQEIGIYAQPVGKLYELLNSLPDPVSRLLSHFSLAYAVAGCHRKTTQFVGDDLRDADAEHPNLTAISVITWTRFR